MQVSLAGHTKIMYGDFSQLFVSSSGMLELPIRLQRSYASPLKKTDYFLTGSLHIIQAERSVSRSKYRL